MELKSLSHKNSWCSSKGTRPVKGSNEDGCLNNAGKMMVLTKKNSRTLLKAQLTTVPLIYMARKW